MLGLSTPKILATPLLLPLDKPDASIHAIFLAKIQLKFLGLVKCSVILAFMFNNISWFHLTHLNPQDNQEAYH